MRLDKAVAKGPPPEVLDAIAKGDAAYKEGKWAEARAEYEKLLALRPDLAGTLNLQIARCYKQEGNMEKQLEYLQKVLDADPANTDIRTLMALEAIEAGMLDRGVYLAPSQFEAGFLSTTHGDAEIDMTIDAAQAVLSG